MIRVVMMDLGDTLVKGDDVLPHVPEALSVLSRFETASGADLALSLVSDYTMPEPPETPQKVKAIFDEYVKELEKLQLKKFFEPVDRHVTLSTHAGVYKPDSLVFKKALQRLRLRAGLNGCLFITENAEHIAACRKLGMETLLFGPTDSSEADFGDWSEGPLLIARKVAPESAQNLRLALQVRLAGAFDMELVSISDSRETGVIEGRAKKLFPVNLKARGMKETVELPFPVNVKISLDEDGKIRDVTSDEPDPEALAESEHYLKTLEANKQISRETKTKRGDETHELKVDEKGRKVLTRRRFTAT